MKLSIFEVPKYCRMYEQVGEYDGCPIYIGPRPPRDWVAQAGPDGRSVYINREVYRKLTEAPQFRRFLEDICEHEIKCGPIHEHDPNPETDENKGVINFLRSKGLLE